MYMVEGGVFTDTDWKELVPGTAEQYGPFDTYKKAKDAWIRHSFTQMLDTCTHRLMITKYNT